MKEKQEECAKCPFFNICAAYIVREKIEDNWKFGILITEKIIINPIKWSQRFCFADFENCVHYPEREQERKKREQSA